MTDMLAELHERMAALSDEQRLRIGRQLTGEAMDDLIRRGDVIEIIRSLRGVAPPPMYQKALCDVQRAVGDLDPPA